MMPDAQIVALMAAQLFPGYAQTLRRHERGGAFASAIDDAAELLRLAKEKFPEVPVTLTIPAGEQPTFRGNT